MIRILLVALFSVILLGCSSGGGAGADPGRANIELLANYYLQYAGAHQKKGPPDEAAFKAYLTSKKVEGADKLFISPRDNQPYVVIYGLNVADDPALISRGPDAQRKIVIIHEKEGAGGKKYAATQSSLILEVEDPASVK